MQTRRLPEGWKRHRQGSFSLARKVRCNPLEALKDYYETKVEVYFIGIYPVEEGEINGMDFAGSCPRPLVSFSLQTPTAMLPNVSVWMRWTI